MVTSTAKADAQLMNEIVFFKDAGVQGICTSQLLHMIFTACQDPL